MLTCLFNALQVFLDRVVVCWWLLWHASAFPRAPPGHAPRSRSQNFKQPVVPDIWPRPGSAKRRSRVRGCGGARPPSPLPHTERWPGVECSCGERSRRCAILVSALGRRRTVF
ncbi:hypothetical protein C8Q77DRAFT_613086 [Trametes polyzona]|nr:hypothetical protein C8Q77DRAFT_613086 [Trametes polyzona]